MRNDRSEGNSVHGLPRKIQFIGGKKSNLLEIDDGSLNTEQVRAKHGETLVLFSFERKNPEAIERNDLVEPQGDYASTSRRIGLLARTII
jgi:hypothetical protein